MLQTAADAILRDSANLEMLGGVLRETELAVHEACRYSNDSLAQSAAALLEAHAGPNCLQTFLTPLWTFRGLLTLLEHSADPRNARASSPYHRGLLTLDRSAAKWPSCANLLHLIESGIAGNTAERASPKRVHPKRAHPKRQPTMRSTTVPHPAPFSASHAVGSSSIPPPA